jgi:hypothetical protein
MMHMIGTRLRGQPILSLVWLGLLAVDASAQEPPWDRHADQHDDHGDLRDSGRKNPRGRSLPVRGLPYGSNNGWTPGAGR